MKFEIKNRWSGKAQITTEIDATEKTCLSVKIGLAAKWANARGADLCDADLCDANLCDANLCGANLCDADLRGADLRGADLRGADLCDANLCGANLCGANLCGANLRGADLRGADLCDANLCDANLCDANLCDANLCGKQLVISPLQIIGLRYFILTNGETVKIGCQEHKWDNWLAFSDEQISVMDDGALEWWKSHKGLIQALVDQHDILEQIIKESGE